MNQTGSNPAPRIIWATRGRSWGFRFLRTAGYSDPLPEYEKAFAQISDQPEGWCRTAATAALRFSDPEQRVDEAGRVILHEVVVFDDIAGQIDSLAEGVERIWPMLADDYARIWDSATPAF